MVHLCDTKWTACAARAELIDQDRWTELTDRTMGTWLAELRDRGVHIGYRERDEIKEEMHRMHASFREAKGRTAGGKALSPSERVVLVVCTTLRRILELVRSVQRS
jgi:hypothetical protein